MTSRQMRSSGGRPPELDRAKRQARKKYRRRSRLGRLVVALVVVGGLAVVGTRFLASANAQGASVGGGQELDSSYFAPGSCVAYPPTQGDKGETVFLDAGHGGVDPGGVGTTQSGDTIYEADETLPVELDAMSLLRADGYRVVVSRTGASTVLKLGPADVSDGVLSLQGAHDDVAARAVCANDAHAQVLVGIYFNSGGSTDDAGSVTVYDADRPFSADNARLANLVQSNVLDRMNGQGWQIPDDGVQSDAGFGSVDGSPATSGLAALAEQYNHLMLLGPAMAGYFETPSQMPGVVIEPLYITDPFEGSIAASPNGQNVIAQGIASAIEQYLGHSSTTASG
jgi:N-acetylmuramoyl-L-alanine amidase